MTGIAFFDPGHGSGGTEWNVKIQMNPAEYDATAMIINKLHIKNCKNRKGDVYMKRPLFGCGLESSG